jgi:hypothetical protein
VSSDRSLVAVGGDLAVAGRVDGDVVVVNGDLHLRPGARISGRAVAVGGGVYRSLLATVDSGVVTFPDDSFVVERRGELLVLAWRERPRQPLRWISMSPLATFRRLGYTRIDGLVLPLAPLLQTADGRFVVEPRVTYRSHLGTIDPALTAIFEVVPGLTLSATGARGTYTNEEWTRGDLRNGVATFWAGSDDRDYYRASLAFVTLSHQRRVGAWALTPSIGVLAERASSVGETAVVGSAPWTFWGRDDTLGIRRPNPAIDDGDVVSGIAYLLAEATAPGSSRMRASARLERSFKSPGNRDFTQVVTDAVLVFPTFGRQSIDVLVHGVHTFGDTPPAQRFHSLGGGATLSTLDTPVFRGDRLFYTAALYRYPLTRPALPFVGPPEFGIRYAVGSAGVGELPEMVQNVGLQIGIRGLRAGVVVDPVEGDLQWEIRLSLRP